MFEIVSGTLSVFLKLYFNHKFNSSLHFVTVVCGIFPASFDHLSADKLENGRIERRISRCNGLSGAGDLGFDVGLPSASTRNDLSPAVLSSNL